jgi:hypothetical protein
MMKFDWISRCAFVGVIALVAADTGWAQIGGGKADKEKQAITVKEGALGDTANSEADAATMLGEENCRCVVGQDLDAIEKIERQLRGAIRSTGLDFQEAPLQEVVQQLQADYGIPIQLDGTALEEIGLGFDEPVTVSLHNISLRSALRLMLKPLQLTYIIQDEVLIITTPEEAESQLVVCVYDVRDLIDGSKDKAGLESLINMIASCVATDSWATNGGGESEIHPIKPGLLVISQTQAVHEEVRSVLATIRHVRGERPEAPEAAAAPAAVDDETVVTRSYLLQLNTTEQGESVRTQVRELILKSLPDDQWDRKVFDQPALLTVLPDRVIVRHTPSVQEKVERLLSESGIGTLASPVGPESGFGGGEFGGVEGAAIGPEPTIAQ